ncbi:MAG: cyclic nucleotide-binding domain-containing protein, partial [Gaiellaceae bacterium]
ELARIPLFGSLSETELAELAPSFESQSAGAGTRLVGEDAAGYSFFALADGEASVTVDGAEVSTLGPGDCFGEIALLDGGRRTASVTTTTPATVYVMFGTEFRMLQQGHPEIAAQLESLMRSRLGA